VELAAVITYTRNSWSNKTGDMVSPAEIKAARSGKSAAAPGASPDEKRAATEPQPGRAQLAAVK
jgi:hypothetical protein